MRKRQNLGQKSFLKKEKGGKNGSRRDAEPRVRQSVTIQLTLSRLLLDFLEETNKRVCSGL